MMSILLEHMLSGKQPPDVMPVPDELLGRWIRYGEYHLHHSLCAIIISRLSDGKSIEYFLTVLLHLREDCFQVLGVVRADTFIIRLHLFDLVIEPRRALL